MSHDLLLIHPPVAKPGEPPAGIAALAGAIRQQGYSCQLLDASQEALLDLISRPSHGEDTWSTRALKNRERNLQTLRTPAGYQNLDRYQRAVRDTNHLLALAAAAHPGVQPSLTNYQDHRNPLASAELLAAAEQFQDSLFYPYYQERILPLIEKLSPRFLGLSLNFLSQALPCFALIGLIRATFPELPLIIGGGLLTSWMHSPDWQTPFAGLIDHCISGAGEVPLLRILGSTSDDIPHHCPDYTDLDWQQYLAPGPILPYSASRGCYWNRCTFCPETAEQSRYQPLIPELVQQDLTTLCRQVSPTLIHLLDNAISPALMHSLAVSPPPAPWYGFARITQQLTDVDFCRQLRTSGCVLLKLGLESGNQKVLDRMAKGIDLPLVQQVLTSLQQAGIATYIYLLFGTPGETLETARETMAFTLRHHRAITFLNLAIFNMPRTSSEAALFSGETFSAGDLSLYCDFVHPQGWDRRAVRSFLDREFKRQPAIAAILRRDPVLFTSNHAAFFTEQFPWNRKKQEK